MQGTLRLTRNVSNSIRECLEEVSTSLRSILVENRVYGLELLTVGILPPQDVNTMLSLFVGIPLQTTWPGLLIEISEVECSGLSGQRIFCGEVHLAKQPKSCSTMPLSQDTDLELLLNEFQLTLNSHQLRGIPGWKIGSLLANTLYLITGMRILFWDTDLFPPEQRDPSGSSLFLKRRKRHVSSRSNLSACNMHNRPFSVIWSRLWRRIPRLRGTSTLRIKP